MFWIREKAVRRTPLDDAAVSHDENRVTEGGHGLQVVRDEEQADSAFLADPVEQVAFLGDGRVSASFYLTQIVSHHGAAGVERFLSEADRRGLALPGVFGVFYYRSANPRTLGSLSQFLPVPVEGLRAEFGAGATPVEVCARTIRAHTSLGARHFYISNLPLRGTAATFNAIMEETGLLAAH
jgi:hypothetical protein